jgi:hypothetical protein
MATQIYFFNYVMKTYTAASSTKNIRPERKSERQRVRWLMGICKVVTERGL